MRHEVLRTAGALLLAALFLGSTCSRSTAPPPAEPPAQEGAVYRVILPDNFAVAVEVAADDATREQGLMFRDQVRPGTGMLFIFPQSGDYPFWMKNTLVPLDMIWLDDQQRVVHVAQRVPPCQAEPCPSYPPGAPARYVLELGGGEAAKHGIADGKALQFQGLEHIVVR